MHYLQMSQKYTVWGKKKHKRKTPQLFFPHVSWKAVPLCAPPAAALQRCREGLHVHPLLSWVLWNTWNQSVLFVRVAPLPVSHCDLCPCSRQQEVMPNLEHAAPGACGTSPCNGWCWDAGCQNKLFSHLGPSRLPPMAQPSAIGKGWIGKKKNTESPARPESKSRSLR